MWTSISLTTSKGLDFTRRGTLMLEAFCTALSRRMRCHYVLKLFYNGFQLDWEKKKVEDIVDNCKERISKRTKLLLVGGGRKRTPHQFIYHIYGHPSLCIWLVIQAPHSRPIQFITSYSRIYIILPILWHYFMIVQTPPENMINISENIQLWDFKRVRLELIDWEFERIMYNGGIMWGGWCEYCELWAIS